MASIYKKNKIKIRQVFFLSIKMLENALKEYSQPILLTSKLKYFNKPKNKWRLYTHS